MISTGGWIVTGTLTYIFYVLSCHNTFNIIPSIQYCQYFNDHMQNSHDIYFNIHEEPAYLS